MKAFHFRLDPALRWRATQLRLERESVSRIVGQVAGLQAELIAKHSELRAGSSELASTGSVAFQSWAAYLDRCRRRIKALEEQLILARKALALQTHKMVDAHRKLRVLENLKRDGHADWAKELSRETEAFAGEAFLARLARKPRATHMGGLRAVIDTRATDTNGLRAVIDTRATDTNGLRAVIDTRATDTNGLRAVIDARATDTNGLRAVIDARATDTNGLRATIEKRTGA